jgi:hypothetical protein
VDTCQRDLADVSVVYLDQCPDGGAPVPKYGQCGGLDWGGPTCCFGYSVCVEVRPPLWRVPRMSVLHLFGA